MLARQNARFLVGFERVAEGGGVALYRAGGAGGADKVSDVHSAAVAK
jgi:hypothetical protein